MGFWNFRNAQPGSEDPATLDIEGELVVEDGWWTPPGAVIARNFRKALDQVGDVVVRINSPGGDVLAGAEIYNALREHSTSGKGRVTVHVTALAASAASVVAMAGDEVLMNPTAYMMIHNPWSFAVGNADDLRQLADQLDEIGEGIVEAYALKTGKSRAKLRELMDAETYMSAPTAIREGFADGLLYQDQDELDSLPSSETQMSAKAVSARMVARVRDQVGSRSEEVGSKDAPADQLRRHEIARRAEIVARSSLVSGDS